MSHKRVNQQTAATVLAEAVQKVTDTQQDAITAAATRPRAHATTAIGTR